MKNPLQELIGLRVAEIRIVHDYLQVIFGETAGLRIFNEYTVTGTDLVAKLRNLELLDAAQDANQVLLTFENGITISVNLLPEAYVGPEAMVLNREGKPVVVWN